MNTKTPDHLEGFIIRDLPDPDTWPIASQDAPQGTKQPEPPFDPDTFPGTYEGYPVVIADVQASRSGTVWDLSFECPFGCRKGRTKRSKPVRHLHGGGLVDDGDIVLGHRVAHCHIDDYPRSGYVLFPRNVPKGFVRDNENPFVLRRVPNLRIV